MYLHVLNIIYPPVVTRRCIDVETTSCVYRGYGYLEINTNTCDAEKSFFIGILKKPYGKAVLLEKNHCYFGIL